MAHPCGQSWRIGSLPCQSTAAARTASKMRRRVGVSSATFGNLILNDLCARLVFQKTDYAAFLDSPPDQWHTFTMSGNQSNLEPDAFSQRRLMVALGLRRFQ